MVIVAEKRQAIEGVVRGRELFDSLKYHIISGLLRMTKLIFRVYQLCQVCGLRWNWVIIGT